VVRPEIDFMPQEPGPATPDLLLVSAQPNRLPDLGPRYKETPPDPTSANAPVPAEPWNTVTAFLFVLIVVFWAWRLRGRYRQYPFITACLPILLAGGVGGTLYHATRTHRVYFLLDVIPISLLGTAGAIYLTAKLARSYGRARVGTIALGLMGVYIVMNFAIRLVPNPPPNLSVNLSYASLAAVLLAPALGVLIRTRFRHVGWVAAALACFAHGWFFRLVDNTPLVNLPMGTHWLWHTYGALTTLFITEYFYRLESETITPVSREAEPSARGCRPLSAPPRG
jgi:hypothetical protein